MRPKAARIGDVRIRRLFAFFPFTIGNDRRWLRFVAVEEMFCVCRWDGQPWTEWIPIRFID